MTGLRRRPDLATVLLAGAIRRIDARTFAESVHGTALELDQCRDLAQQCGLARALESYGLEWRSPLSAPTLPDAIWQAICLGRPQLGCYPLGESAERAVKRTIASVAPPLRADPASECAYEATAEYEKRLGDSFVAVEREDLLRLFLVGYLFEIAIDRLRRPREDSRLDSAYRYHFSRAQAFSSLAAEREFRDALTTQCEEQTDRLLEVLLGSSSGRSSVQIERQVTRALRDTLGVEPVQKLSRERRDKPLVNVIVGRQPRGARERFAISRRPLHLTSHAATANVAFSFDALSRSLGGPVHSLVKDLIDIGIALFMADLHTRRPRDLGRRLGILIPVRHLDRWREVRPILNHTASFLGRDAVEFQFADAVERRDVRRDLSLTHDDRCVSLLSGGLDSAAGAVWLLKRGLRPTFVSQYKSNQLASQQREVVATLKAIARQNVEQDLEHIAVRVGRRSGGNPQVKLTKPLDSVMSHFLRSFLFLSLGAGVALERGIARLYVFENGPVALNPLFSEGRVNTRTTHPQLLKLFERIVKVVFDGEIAIENPFLYLTKGEVAKLLAGPEESKLLKKTNSCWNWFIVPQWAKKRGKPEFKGMHDGDCLPCFLRRAAVYIAGLSECDAEYLSDVLQEFPTVPRERVTAVADYLRFAWRIQAESDDDVISHSPDFSVYVPGVDPRDLIAMYRRHARELQRYCRGHAGEAFRTVFAPALEE